MKKNEPTLESLTQALISVADETWRFKKVFERLIATLSPAERDQILKQQKWFEQRIRTTLAESGIDTGKLNGWNIRTDQDYPDSYDCCGFLFENKNAGPAEADVNLIALYCDPVNNKH